MRGAQLVLSLVACAMCASSASADEGNPLLQIAPLPGYRISFPLGSELRSKAGVPLATLRAGDAAAFASHLERALEADREATVLPIPGYGERRVELGFTPDSEYARRINAMSRIEFMTQQAMMKRVFLGDLAKKSGEHAAESSAIVFHNKFRGVLYLSMSKAGSMLDCRMIMDVFRNGTVYSANIHWRQPSGKARDPLVESIIDSITVDP